MNSSEQQAPERRQSGGFFQVSTSELHRVVALGGGVNEMAAYVVLCSGVNGRHADRLCTHGAKSISTRSGMTYRAADKAVAWLLAQGFIRAGKAPPPLEEKARQSTLVRWVICDLAGQPDVGISRQFVDGVKGSARGGPLKRMFAEITGGEEFTRTQAFADAMKVFMALMKEQDYGDCAGVDPQAWSQGFEPVAPDEYDGIAKHIEPLPQTDGVVVTVKESNTRLSNWSFVLRALGEEGAEGAQREQLERRFWHAISQLRRLELIYRVLILWKGNPLDSKQGRVAEPLATQYINDSWARKIDPHLQHDAHRAIWRAEPGYAYEDFGGSTGGAIPFVGSGRYRYIVRADQAHKIHLLGQLRVRYWPANESTVLGREREEERTRSWSEALSKIR